METHIPFRKFHFGQAPGLPGIGLTSAIPLLKAIYTQDDKEATLKKAADIEQKLHDMGLKSAAKLYHKGEAETLTYLDFPHKH